MTGLCVAGIDPGREGGVAVLRAGALLGLAPLPLAGRLVDTRELIRIISAATGPEGPALLAIEEQQARPQDGFRSLNFLLPQYGQLLEAGRGQGWPTRAVKPRTWKRLILMGTARDKDAAIGYARLLHPEADLYQGPGGGRKRKAHDGLADAICIAEWASRQG